MRTTALIAVLVVALPVAGQDEKKPDGPPLQPLTQVAKHLNAGIAEFLKGKDPADAFKPWEIETPEEGALEKLRSDLKAAGVASAVSYTFEFEITFLKESRPIYHLRAIVFADEKEAGLYSAAKSKADLPSKARPLADYKEQGEPFQAAAKSVISALADPASEIPFVDSKKLAKLVFANPDKDEKELAKSIAKAKDFLAGERAKLAGVPADGHALQLDDHAFATFDAAGKPVGMIKCSFQKTEAGKIRFGLYRFIAR